MINHGLIRDWESSFGPPGGQAGEAGAPMLGVRRAGGPFMHSGVRKIVGILAIYTIALNTILMAALAPVPTAAAFDPLSVICHSIPDAAAGNPASPDGPPAKPGKACDHCTLCGATTPAAMSADAILTATLEPGTLVAVLRPDETPRRASAVRSANLARGPPLSA